MPLTTYPAIIDVAHAIEGLSAKARAKIKRRVTTVPEHGKGYITAVELEGRRDRKLEAEFDAIGFLWTYK